MLAHNCLLMSRLIQFEAADSNSNNLWESTKVGSLEDFLINDSDEGSNAVGRHNKNCIV